MGLFFEDLNGVVAEKVATFFKTAVTRESGRYISLDDAYLVYLRYRRWQDYQADEWRNKAPYLTKSEFLAYFRYVAANLLCLPDTVRNKTIVWDDIMFREDVLKYLRWNPATAPKQ